MWSQHLHHLTITCSSSVLQPILQHQTVSDRSEQWSFVYFKLYLLVLILAAGTAHCVEPWKVSAEHWTVNVKNVQGWQLSSSHSSQSVLNNVLMLLRVHFLGSGIFWRHCALITKMFNNYHYKHDTVLLQENQPFTQTISNIILWLLPVTLVKWNQFIVIIILCLPPK